MRGRQIILGAKESNITDSQTNPNNPKRVGMSLRTNFSWSLAGNVTYSACQWLMLVVLAKLGSPEIVGRFALGFAVTAPVVMLANLQLRIVLATDAKQEYVFGDYLGLRLLTSVMALLVIIGIAAFSGYPMETMLVVIAIGVAKTFESISDVLFGYVQLHEQMDRIAISGIIKGIASTAALTALFYFTKSVFWGSVGLAAVWGIVLLTYDARCPKIIAKLLKETHNSEVKLSDLRPRWDKKTLYKLAKVSFPLGIVMMLISLNTNIPRYVVERFLGERNLGIFAAMTYLMVAGTTVISALSQSAVPRLAKYYAARDVAAFRGLMAKLMALGLVIGGATVAVVLIAGRWILTTFYGPEYAAHLPVFIWIAVASAVFFVQWFLGNGMTAARCFKVQVPLLAATSAVTAVSAFLLIPKYGLLGSAWTLVLANIFLVLGTLWVDIAAMNRLKRHTSDLEEQNAASE